MEHFSVIQTLCRIGLEGPDPRFRKQVERLRDRLRGDKDEKSATAIERLLAGAQSEHSLTPSAVEVSRLLVTGDATLLKANLQQLIALGLELLDGVFARGVAGRVGGAGDLGELRVRRAGWPLAPACSAC